MVKKDLSEKGYSKEEEYFFNLNKELIEKKRKDLDSHHSEQKKTELQIRHWMHCPKCGHEMKEREFLGIIIDKCNHCSGLYFDHGELEILMESKEPKGFLSGLKRLFE